MYLAYCKNQALNIIESPSSATGTCLQLVVNWRPLAHRKLLQLISQQTFLFCKQTCRSLQNFDGKPRDDISCVPLCIVTCTIGVNGHEDFVHGQSRFDRFWREDNTDLSVPEIKALN